jgi:asparagine synthase (glutamine-hydrolysing)
MCGICGIWFKGSGIRPSVGLLREMTDTLVHRGPDEEGIHIISDCGLGHRRLRIIDLSTGQQPMTNEDGSVWVVFNGEIYNFKELRATLQAQGHSFKTRSDTEVLVHLYEKHGKMMAGLLHGMFAFAIWDDKKKELFLCRDRLGIKPLYYYDSPTCLAFASELKTLLPLFPSPPELLPEAITDYFTFGYVPSPITPFKGLRKLAPAQRAVISANHTTVDCYWDPVQQEGVHYADSAERLAELLDESVRIRLISDVDFGAFLSGGVDSSTVCAVMRRHVSGALKTFSIGFSEEAYDELPYSNLVAGHLGTDHHTEVVMPDAIALLPKLSWHFDEPFSDSSAIPTWYVSELARRHVAMVHSGDGGDELFGGYARYFNELRLQSWTKSVGKKTLRFGSRFLNFLPSQGNRLNRLRRIVARAQMDPAQRYKSGVGIAVNGFERIVRTELRERTSGFFEKAFRDSRHLGESVSLRSLGLVDVKTYLPEDVLTKVDRMSMAHSLEARVPLLDHRLVEFAFTLPDSLKIDPKGGGKRILKELAATLVPPEVIYRPKKGFGVPLAEWFRHELCEVISDLNNSPVSQVFDFIDRRFIQEMIRDHVAENVDHAERLWSVLMFQNWFETYVSSPRKPYRHVAK